MSINVSNFQRATKYADKAIESIEKKLKAKPPAKRVTPRVNNTKQKPPQDETSGDAPQDIPERPPKSSTGLSLGVQKVLKRKAKELEAEKEFERVIRKRKMKLAAKLMYPSKSKQPDVEPDKPSARISTPEPHMEENPDFRRYRHNRWVDQVVAAKRKNYESKGEGYAAALRSFGDGVLGKLPQKI